MASSYVTPTGDFAYWTNRSERVTRTWIEEETNPPVEGVERWFCIEFDLSELQSRQIYLPLILKNYTLPTPTIAPQPPIRITFNVHFDPVMANFQSWRERKENLKWLRDFIADYPEGQRPRLNLQVQGDHAEFYLIPDNPESADGRAVLQDLVDAGHTLGTHIHKSVRGDDPSSWRELEVPEGGHICLNPDELVDPPTSDLVELMTDHITWVEGLFAQLGVTEPVSANQSAAVQLPRCYDNKDAAFAGTLSDGTNTVPHGFAIETGGRNECFNAYFDHDVFTPWRPGPEGPLDEDLLNDHTVMVPGLPDVGSAGQHFSMPYDSTVPAYQRRFIQLLLQRLYSQYTGADSQVWTFGWHIHLFSIYPDEAPVPDRMKLRGKVQALVDWLNERYIGRTDALGGVVAEYATIPEVADAFTAWEEAHPGQSSFEYNLTAPDMDAYPYDLLGLTIQLANAHYAEALTAPDDELQVIRFDRCPHSLRGETDGYWGYETGGTLGCYDQPASEEGEAQGNPLPTTTVYVAWRDAAEEEEVDLVPYVGSDAQVYDAVTGEEILADLSALPLSYRAKIIVPIADGGRLPPLRPAHGRHHRIRPHLRGEPPYPKPPPSSPGR
jgi:hypothetical protein